MRKWTPAYAVLPVVRRLRAEGATYREIGQAINVSISRAHWICKRYGVKGPVRAPSRIVLPSFPGIIDLARTAQKRHYWQRSA